ncbi:putative CFEM domain-containing protein [Colletotrichum sublineola]|uniref:Putative CFEM domain-containing protein n=1 Tax=Colletotrichum sublineola TaxID=1173701 RepID=A0A066XKQ7_COLSU|nr:putative CFEM domain-containing protein [Colletotrichum sublineola]
MHTDVLRTRRSNTRIGNIPLWWDDWTAMISLFFLMLTLGCGIASKISPEISKNFVRAVVNPVVLQTSNLALVFTTGMWNQEMPSPSFKVSAKVSICAMYLRIFVTRWTRIFVIGLIVSLVAQHFLFFFMVLFQCTPIQYVWDKSIPGSCLNVTALGYSGAALTITYDCILIVLPLPQLLKLHVDVRKKLVLILLLALGSVACVASMVRLKVLVTFTNTYDATWDNVEINIWSTLEIDLAMICGSLPALLPLFSKMKEKMGSFTHRRHNESVAESENQIKLGDTVQFRASDQSDASPDSPSKLEEMGCNVSPSGTHS